MAKKKAQSAVTDASIKKAYSQFSSSKQDLDDQRMGHASLCKKLEDRGIHRPALKLVAKLLAMDVAKAQDFMRSFDRYADVLGLDQKLAGQPDMLDEDEEGETEPETVAETAETPDYSPEAVH